MRKSALLALAAAACLPAVFEPASAQSSWTGYYIGGNLGARFTDADWRTTAIYPTLPPPLTATPDNTASRSFDEGDWRFGAYGGVNLMVTPTFLLGIEAGIGTSVDSSNPSRGIPGAPNAVPGFPNINTSQDRVSIAVDWDANIRARFGVLVTPATLAYMTAGVAFADVVFRASCVGDPGVNACFANHTEVRRKIETGWTIGGGVEQALGGNLFARIDYSFADFGSFGHTFFRGARSTVPLFDDQFIGRTELVTHTVNLGLAYKF